MSTFRVDLSPLQHIAVRLGAFDRNQMPFAMAGALNAVAEIGRRTLIEDTWPRHVTVRDANFLKAALTTRGKRATKRNLRVEVYDRLGRANLTLHETGGTKKPRGKAIAVPSAALQGRRSSRGVPKGLRPRAVPNSFVKGDVLYQRIGGKGKDRHLRLMYVLKPTTRIGARVPFHADFDGAVRRAFPGQFRTAMRRAMSTALKK